MLNFISDNLSNDYLKDSQQFFLTAIKFQRDWKNSKYLHPRTFLQSFILNFTIQKKHFQVQNYCKLIPLFFYSKLSSYSINLLHGDF